MKLNQFISNLNPLNKKISFFFVVTVFIYGATPFLSPNVNRIAQIFLGLILFLLFLTNKDNFIKDKMSVLFVLVIILQIATWLSVKMFEPSFAYSDPKIDRLGKLFLFIPIAWVMSRNKKFNPYFFACIIGGFFCAIVFKNNFLSEIQAGIRGIRLDFGIRNAQHTSMVFGVLFLFSFISFFFMKNEKKNALVFIVLMGLSFAGLFFTQTRQAFLGLVVSFSITLPTAYFMKIISFKRIIIVLIICLIFLIALIKFGGLDSRFDVGWNNFKKIVNVINSDKEFSSFDKRMDYYIKNLPDSGSIIRVKTWFCAFKMIRHRPVLGWGANSRGLVIKKSEMLSKKLKKAFGHLHNFPIEIILAYGFTGFFLISFMYIHVLNSVFKCRNNYASGNLIFIFGLSFIIYWFVINNFESMNSFWPGVFINNVVLGFLYSNYLRERNLQIDS